MLEQDEDAMNREWANILLKLGVQGGIAVFLVWRLASGLDDLGSRLRATENQHSEMIGNLREAETVRNRALLISERMLAVLQQTCIQQARGGNSFERADAQSRCFGTR